MDNFKYNEWILTGPLCTNTILTIADPLPGYDKDARFQDGKSRPVFHYDCGSCQGAVLAGGSVSNATRYAMIIPTNIYRENVDYTTLYNQWIGFVQLFNPNIKLYFPNSEKTVADVLGLPNLAKDVPISHKEAWNWYFHQDYWNGTPSWEAYSKEKSINSLEDFVRQQQKFIIIEFPKDVLSGLTLTLVRYLSRSYYQAIPKFVLELYNIGLPPVAALYMGHYATNPFIWESRAKFQEFLGRLDEKTVNPTNSILKLLPKIDPEDGTRVPKWSRYNNYYGLVAPHVVEYKKLIKLTIPEYLKRITSKDGVTKPINGILLPQEKLYMSMCGGYSTLILSATQLWTHAQSLKGLTGVKKIATEIVDPVYELVESANTKPIVEFVADVERISNKIYETSNNAGV